MVKRTLGGTGSLTDLKSFVELVLKLKAKWTGKKSGGKQTFQGHKVSINWWPSKKTLHVQGSPDFTEQVEEQLDNLHKDFKQKVASNDYGKQTRKNKRKRIRRNWKQEYFHKIYGAMKIQPRLKN